MATNRTEVRVPDGRVDTAKDDIVEQVGNIGLEERLDTFPDWEIPPDADIRGLVYLDPQPLQRYYLMAYWDATEGAKQRGPQTTIQWIDEIAPRTQK